MKVAILGANGRTGLALIKAFKAAAGESEDKSIELIGVLRDKSKLSDEVSADLAAIVEGDCTLPETVTETLSHSPDVIVCAVGAVSHEGVQTTRTDATRVFLAGITDSPGIKFVCVSSFGAADSMSQTNFAIRFFLNRLLRQPLADHTSQEKLITDTLTDTSRWLIVRPTGLKDTPDGPRKDYQLSAPPEKIRSSAIGRDDVAHFIVKQTVGEPAEDESYWGKLVTITW